MFVRNWGNPDNQPEFNNPKIQRGLDLAKKLSKKTKEGKKKNVNSGNSI